MLLGLPDLLRVRSASRGSAASRGGEKGCIFVFQQGGLSHIDSWDPKPDAPEELRGPYRPIATAVPGLRIGELMPGLARRADRYCLIRSMSHQDTRHGIAIQLSLTGRSKLEKDAPFLGSIVSRVLPSRKTASYVWMLEAVVDEWKLKDTSGFLGAAHAPLIIGKGSEDHFANPRFRVTVFDPPPGITVDQLQQRQALLGTLEMVRAAGPSSSSLDGFTSHQTRAFDLLTGAGMRGAFDVEKEPAPMRDRYGRHPLGQNLLVARRLIEAGVRLVTVNAFPGMQRPGPNAGINTWDMHGSPTTSIFGTDGLPFALPRLDQAVSALLDDLQERGMLDSTLVVVAGEFGRTPKVSAGFGVANAQPGRDHHAACYSAMLAGAGIRGGAVYGASDRIGAFPRDKLVSLEDFSATLLHALGVPPETRLSQDGFTRPASLGQPILDLFG